MKNIGESNADICLGLLYEKGYGVEKDLNKALSIYTELKEKKKKENILTFDFSLTYRLAKVLNELGRTEEANNYFKSIFMH